MKIIKVDAKTGARTEVESESYTVGTYSELPKYKEKLGQFYEVTKTTGLIGFRKHAGLYQATDKGWVLLEKTKENGEL